VRQLIHGPDAGSSSWGEGDPPPKPDSFRREASCGRLCERRGRGHVGEPWVPSRKRPRPDPAAAPDPDGAEGLPRV
jgi:hypothetical protein